MRQKELTLSGWGRTSAVTVGGYRPERISAVVQAVQATQAGGTGGVIAFGGGRSYGDAALNGGGAAILTERLDRILELDVDAGELVCEPGVRISDTQSLLVPRGLSLPAIPGTAFATIGGAVANDIHGKNHDRDGSFGDHVRWLDLLTADGTVHRVKPDQDGALFNATVGGIGLTGIILAVCVGLLRVPSNAVRVREMRVRDLDHFFELLAEHRDKAMYSVGWIDALARGPRLGRGILEVADPSPEGVEEPPQRPRRVPVDMPDIFLNRLSIGALNAFYYGRVPAAGRTRTMPMTRFFHPLDAVLDWNRLYGRGGFHQFQCVIPEEGSRTGIRALLETITASGSASFLAVLKTMGRSGRGHLSFPIRGHTLALDFPARGGARDLLARLETITLDHGGRVYLAKDSTVSAVGFAKMYPALPDFREVLAEVDPRGVFASDLARRLGIREDLA